MRALLRDAHASLLRAIRALTRAESASSGDEDRQSPVMIVESIASEDWASATFVGQRHRLEVRLEGPRDVVEAARARLAQRLADEEIIVSGHIVADFQLAETRWVATAAAMTALLVCEALTIED